MTFLGHLLFPSYCRNMISRDPCFCILDSGDPGRSPFLGCETRGGKPVGLWGQTTTRLRCWGATWRCALGTSGPGPRILDSRLSPSMLGPVGMNWLKQGSSPQPAATKGEISSGVCGSRRGETTATVWGNLGTPCFLCLNWEEQTGCRSCGGDRRSETRRRNGGGFTSTGGRGQGMGGTEGAGSREAWEASSTWLGRELGEG